jgi:hypothetical protein
VCVEEYKLMGEGGTEETWGGKFARTKIFERYRHIYRAYTKEWCGFKSE